jgi:hypothetical protein
VELVMPFFSLISGALWRNIVRLKESTYSSQGWWEEAEKLKVQVMETRKTTLGANHPDTLTSMGNLAFTYWSQDRYAEAINLMSRCIKEQAVKLGVMHPAYRNNAITLAHWKSELGVPDAGMSTWRRS